MTRSAATQVVQIGKETTPGTVHAATRRLASMSIEPKAEAEVSTFRAAGNKYVSVTSADQVWSSAKVSGQPDYNEIVFPLASIFGSPVTTVSGSGWQHVFSPVSEGADAAQSFTIEKGDPTGTLNAERLAFGLFTDFGMTFSRKGNSVDGAILGRKLAKGVTMTGALTSGTPVPILPGQIDVYAADAVADLGLLSGTGVKFAQAMSAKVGCKGRFNPAWFMDSSQASWTSFVESAEPDYTIEWLCEADTTGLAWLDLLETGATKFVRLQATGPLISVGVNYKVMWDFAVKVTDPGDFSDEDGIYAIGPTLTVVHDGGWGRASRVTVVNTVNSIT